MQNVLYVTGDGCDSSSSQQKYNGNVDVPVKGLLYEQRPGVKVHLYTRQMYVHNIETIIIIMFDYLITTKCAIYSNIRHAGRD